MTYTKMQTAEERAQRRAGYLVGLAWHAGTFVIINAFFRNESTSVLSPSRSRGERMVDRATLRAR